MIEIEVQEYAHQLLAAFGDRAVVEAARRAVESEQQKTPRRRRPGAISKRR